MARTWIDTKWQHQGRLKGISCDCIGLMVMTTKEVMASGFDLGIMDFVDTIYGRIPHGGQMERTLRRHLVEIPKEQMLPADILMMAWRIMPMHLAFLGNYRHDGLCPPYSLIHALVESEKVSEHRLTAEWEERIMGVYRFKTLGAD